MYPFIVTFIVASSFTYTLGSVTSSSTTSFTAVMDYHLSGCLQIHFQNEGPSLEILML